MRLADIDVDELVRALGQERSAWINVARDEKRRSTDPERATVCVLAALDHVFTKFAGR
ncbi:hypothetical protein [Bradyrhizobium sp. CCGUVB23]|uniref:hypothetical protein n=1 Tax=Bradyrhizobium sp. CCGUVB23 TaxID=2949630 RepID=UPI0020B3C774|nr:hypothetical protein [Bradyrhizobium sp. CCGUVB23]MCP3461470.1 hypothetical protein [Bradyrhizobium sp. CCGUVB23]